jgi:hypothetical protein
MFKLQSWSVDHVIKIKQLRSAVITRVYVIHFQPTSSLKSAKVAVGAVEVRFQFGEKDNLVVRIDTLWSPNQS